MCRYHKKEKLNIELVPKEYARLLTCNFNIWILERVTHFYYCVVKGVSFGSQYSCSNNWYFVRSRVLQELYHTGMISSVYTQCIVFSLLQVWFKYSIGLELWSSQCSDTPSFVYVLKMCRTIKLTNIRKGITYSDKSMGNKFNMSCK